MYLVVGDEVLQRIRDLSVRTAHLMSVRFVLVMLVVAGCASSADPQLVSIEPNLATSLVETVATVHGRELAAVARVDLDSSYASIDLGWRIRIAGELLPTTWRDRAQLDVVIPRGLTAGVHDVVALAPDGRELVLPAALTITNEPVGLRLSIEDARGGTGQPVSGVHVAGDQGDAFSIIRDPAGAFVIDVAAAWSTTGPFADVAPSSDHARFEARIGGTGRLIAHHAGADLTAESGDMTTIAGATARIAIADGPAGTGTEIGDCSGLTTDADGGLVAHAVGVDAFGNATGDVTATWSLDGVSGSLPGAPASSATIDFATPGAGQLHAAHVSLGTTSTGTLTVIAGRAATLAISPSGLDVVAGEPGVAFVATGSDGDGNPTANLGTVGWSIASGPITAIDANTGMLTPVTAGTGAVRAISSYGATATSDLVRIRGGAALTAVAAVPVQVVTGQTFTVAVTIRNAGDNAATNITLCPLSVTGPGGAMITTTPSGIPTLPAGAQTVATWAMIANAPGALAISTCASASDATTSASISTLAAAATTVVDPSPLTATLEIPAIIGRDATFTATLTLVNTSAQAATGVHPSVLTTSGSGTATLTGVPSGPITIAAGASAVLTWTYVATTVGTLQLHGGALGQPPVDSGVADIVDAYVAAVDPFGDSSPAGFVTGYRGQLYLGPNASGTSAVRLSSASAAPEPLTFLFGRDVVGNRAENSTSAPYSSIGGAGCVANTPACGPDNENQRGQFTSFAIAGTEWLIASGARSDRGATYLYMTTDTDPQLDFRYVDLHNVVSSGNSYGVSALGAADDRLYIGIAGRSSQGSVLYSLTTMPSAPGLDATVSDIVDMRLYNISAWNPGVDLVNLDAIGTVGGIVYAANRHAWVRATVASPKPLEDLCLPLVCSQDWREITPSATAYSARASYISPKGGDLEPRDRAVVAVVGFGDRIFAARNTTSGPQLWSCRATANACDSDDWQLVAANSTGDTLLSQFDDPALTSLTMLVATASHLYVGFDSAAGVQVFRTANPAAAARTDFEGANGCSAALATCDGLGGPGAGAPGNTRIFDAKAITANGTTAVWLTAGDATSPLSLLVLP